MHLLRTEPASYCSEFSTYKSVRVERGSGREREGRLVGGRGEGGRRKGQEGGVREGKEGDGREGERGRMEGEWRNWRRRKASGREENCEGE